MEFESLLKAQVALSFHHIRQVAPAVQERASHAGLCHVFIVYVVFFFLLVMYCAFSALTLLVGRQEG